MKKLAIALSALSLLMAGHVPAFADAEPTGTITALLVDEKNRPISGVNVYLNGDLQWSDTTTDSSGRFTLPDLAPESRISLQLSDDYGVFTGYLPSAGRLLTQSMSKARRFVVEADQTTDLGTVRIDSTPRLRSASAINTTSYKTVRDSFKRKLLPYAKYVYGPTPKGGSCKVKPTSSRAKKQMLATVNWQRSLAGLDPVKLDDRLNARAQRSSVIQYYARDLSHEPSKKSKCWSKIGADAAGSSNLYMGATAGAAGLGYVDDVGVRSLGHRSWVLAWPTTAMGTGDVGNYNSLYVVDPKAGSIVRARPEWTAWPSPGYFPHRLEPSGWWSWQPNRSDISIDKAKVKVTDPSGKTVATKRLSEAYEYGQIGFVLQRTVRSGSYTVSISGLELRDRAYPVSYKVRFFKG